MTRKHRLALIFLIASAPAMQRAIASEDIKAVLLYGSVWIVGVLMFMSD